MYIFKQYAIALLTMKVRTTQQKSYMFWFRQFNGLVADRNMVSYIKGGIQAKGI